MGDSGDFIFRRTEGGDLTWHGDFEGLYRAMDDPWGQSGAHPRMRDYYADSRQRLVDTLVNLSNQSAVEVRWRSALEVGCGTGYVTRLLREKFPGRRVHGCDISHTAIERAWALHHNAFFYTLDIAKPVEEDRFYVSNYDVVVLNQILWYVLERLALVLDNCGKLLLPDGHLIIHTAFLDEQNFGRHVLDGFHGLIRWVLENTSAWHIVGAYYDPTSRHAPYHDGVLVLQKGSQWVANHSTCA